MNARGLSVLRIEAICVFSDSRSLVRSDWYHFSLRSWPTSDHAKVEDPIMSLARRLAVFLSSDDNVAIFYTFIQGGAVNV